MKKNLIEALHEEINPAQFKAIAKSMINGKIHLLYYSVREDHEEILVPFFEKYLNKVGATLRTKDFSLEELSKEYGFNSEQLGETVQNKEVYRREVVTIYPK